MNKIGNVPPEIFAIALILYIWSLIWKAIALWRSANLKQRNWFMAMLMLLILINDFGIVSIVYLFFFATKKMKLVELKFWEKKKPA